MLIWVSACVKTWWTRGPSSPSDGASIFIRCIESHSNIQEWYEAGTRHWEASVTREWENIAHWALMIGMATVVQFHRSVVFLEAQHGYSAALSSSVGPAFVWLAICIDSERWAQRWRWAGEGTCGSVSRPVWLEQRFWRKEGWEKVWGM